MPGTWPCGSGYQPAGDSCAHRSRPESRAPTPTHAGRAASGASGQTRPTAVRRLAATPRWLRSERQRVSRDHKEIIGLVSVRCGRPTFPEPFTSRRRFTRPLWLRSCSFFTLLSTSAILPLDSNICSRQNVCMSALLDLHPDAGHPVLSGVAEVHGALDRMHAGAAQPLVSGEHARVVAELDRATRRIEALKMKVVAAIDRAGTAKDAGSPTPVPGLRRRPRCPGPTQPAKSHSPPSSSPATTPRRQRSTLAWSLRPRRGDRERHRTAT